MDISNKFVDSKCLKLIVSLLFYLEHESLKREKLVAEGNESSLR